MNYRNPLRLSRHQNLSRNNSPSKRSLIIRKFMLWSFLICSSIRRLRFFPSFWSLLAHFPIVDCQNIHQKNWRGLYRALLKYTGSGTSTGLPSACPLRAPPSLSSQARSLYLCASSTRPASQPARHSCCFTCADWSIGSMCRVLCVLWACEREERHRLVRTLLRTSQSGKS